MYPIFWNNLFLIENGFHKNIPKLSKNWADKNGGNYELIRELIWITQPQLSAKKGEGVATLPPFGSALS